MGKTTSVLSNHNLDISSVENLAKDLSIRLKATIIYGYDKAYFISDKQELDLEYEFISIDKIEHKNATATYVLTDVNFAARKFLDENSCTILDSETLKIEEYVKKSIVEEYNSIEFELQSLKIRRKK